MTWPFASLSLIDGPLPWVALGAGAAGAVWLVGGRRRWFRRIAMPTALAAATALTAGAAMVIEEWWKPFPDPLPPRIHFWAGIVIAALILLIPRAMAADRKGQLVTGCAVLAVLLAAVTQMNLVYAPYPTLGAVFGYVGSPRVTLAELPAPTRGTVEGEPLEEAWRPEGELPHQGAVAVATVAGTTSGFAGRDARIFLPPAYFADPQPVLPVLVLLHGQPGAPEDWLVSGRLADTMDSFAAAHHGLAPVIVMPDATGGALANPLCMDSALGNAAGYLTRDLPAWITAHLRVNPDHRAWAIAGASYGGTCALQLATTAPEVYPTFLDFSGQAEPTLGDRARTVAKAFHGNDSAFRSVNPADQLGTRRYSDSAGVFVVGASDDRYRPDQEALCAKAVGSIASVDCHLVSGGHDWRVWSTALARQMPWLTHRLGLTSG
ncbi:esterase [Nocardia yunnanensis]|uniref:Esterase n=1 Tax=Nocardia yunnanensis TaxID=2382165 RepID=A0A386ZCZ2_9NOCA|nr:alpha/beta hydrolase-fold protein [Nocardia yunnanensis]AYF75460.1 esterase [Nocardia yunnanensis]